MMKLLAMLQDKYGNDFSDHYYINKEGSK